ncbi:MAG: Gmad2 immunoglobulin-like domain-containing protein [Patescibacteria group bacterium]|nr:Gmad2 immunoglobulin-like domain-containing protein [Patescibacteria group bacterium]MDD4610431.1 Gmad2 immunoglobulin-like domain-containing protein [Patescibacteria group bacterium]
MKKFLIIFGVALAVCVVIFSIRFFLGGPEDAWICSNGEWVRHGQPSSPAPTTGCGEKEIVCSDYNLENCPSNCVVCPPCAACSSLSCQAEDFCKSIGFDKDWYPNMQSAQKKITNFNDCAAAGNPVMESFPRKCNVGGQTYTEEISNDSIKIDYPQPNQKISSPLKISGQARGNWFFEASFPVVLVNWDGLIIAEGQAKAQSDWMTENFVPFTAELTFTKPEYKDNGALILKKDNPSGLPENADFIEMPIIFE